MEYTKGEWRLSEVASVFYGDKVVQRKIVTSSQYGDVELQINSVSNKYPEAEGNAHILAASKDMYEAIKALSFYKNAWQDTLGEKLAKQFSDALNKAEGKTL